MKYFCIFVAAFLILQPAQGQIVQFSGAASPVISNCPQGTALPDGCSGAAATGVQNTSLLNSYGVKRPAWNVAGVDYPVGLPTSVTLSDPAPGGTAIAAGLSALGCTLNATNSVPNSTIGCGGSSCNNQTISGWNFALHNGIRLETQCNNIHITQNNFAVGSNTVPNLHIMAGTNSCLIDFNTFDGSGIPTTDGNHGDLGGLLTINNIGTCTIQYNWMQNAYFQLMEKGGDASGTTTQVTKFNYLKDSGTGHLPSAVFTGSITSGVLHVTAVTSGSIGLLTQICTTSSCAGGANVGYVTSFVGGATGGVGDYNLGIPVNTASQTLSSGDSHGDSTQDFTATGFVIANLVYNFDTWVQTGTNSTQPLSICSAGGQIGGSGQCSGATVQNNTIILGINTSISFGIIIDNTWNNGASTVNQNYVDQSGIIGGGSWFFFGAFNGVGTDGPFNGTLTTCTGNKDLVSGATITATGGNVGSVCS